MSAFDHDEIYLQPVCCVNEDIGRLWCEDPDPEDCEDGKHWTRYVRADIHESAIAEIEVLRQERDKLRARVAELEAALQGMLDIVADSRGVAGYHLNGDTAEWDEFDEVDAAEKLLNKLEADNG